VRRQNSSPEQQQSRRFRGIDNRIDNHSHLLVRPSVLYAFTHLTNGRSAFYGGHFKNKKEEEKEEEEEEGKSETLTE
jgi:hypothetical protein